MSKGAGDLNIKVECMNLQETYGIEDCYRYDNATSDKSSNYTKTSSLSVSHSTDHYILTASSNNRMMCIGSGYDNVRYEILMSGTSHFQRGVYCSDTQNYYETNSVYNIYQTNNNYKRIQMADITGGSWSAIKETSYTFTNNTYYRFIIEINGTSITLKVETEDGTVIESQTVTKSLNAHYVGTLMYSGTAYVKGIKVKPL